VALAATGLAAFAAARPWTRVAALLPVVLGAAIAVPAMPPTLSVAWIEDHRALEVVCTDGERTLCIPRLHAHALDHVRGPAAQALSILAAKLPPAPTRVLVRSVDRTGPAEPLPPDTLVVTLSSVQDVTEYPPDDLLWIMLDGAGVPPCGNFKGLEERPDDRYWAARLVAAAWLLDRDLAPVDRTDRRQALASDALADLRGLPADEQLAQVTALRDAERTCAEGDRLEMLTGVSASR
jgi:hypothetical protein